MAKWFALWRGEIVRLWRYKITLFGLLISLLWVIILFLVSKPEAQILLPQLLVIDSGLMSIILLGAGYFFEKQEGTIKAVLVAPVPSWMILSAKVFATTLGSLITLIFLWIVAYFFHQLPFSFFYAFFIILLTTVAHLSLGYVLIYWSKDFMELLLKYSLIALLLFTPNLLVNFLPDNSLIRGFSFLSPTYASQYSMRILWGNPFNFETWISLIILILIPTILFPFMILPQFKAEAVSV